MLSPRVTRAIYLLVVLFWFFSVWNLDRLPVVHQDEPWILAPGYKLFTQGIYGSDFFTGFYGMERHYLQFMPLMSLLEGLVTHVAGANLFAMRLVPVACALLTIALTFALGKTFASPSVGLLACTLMMTWAWLPAGGRALPSGVPLVDLARIVRYDILVPPLGLAALLLYSKSMRGGQDSLLLVSGIFAGLAGLAHLYGLFWLAALGSLGLLRQRDRLRTLILLATGSLLIWLPWLAILVQNWTDYLAQIFQDRARYAVLDPNFFLTNFLTEPQRYHLNWDVPGVWLLVAGVPLAFISTLWLSRENKQLRAIAIPAALLWLLVALLTSQKLFNYLGTVVPLFALLVAIALLYLWRLRWFGTVLSSAIVLIILVSGAVQLQIMQAQAARTPSPTLLFTELRATIPVGSIVLGHPQYGLPFMDSEYRSVLLLFLLADKNANRQPISMTEALERVAPQYVIYDPAMDALFSDRSTLENAKWNDEFHAYLSEHHATVTQMLWDQEQNRLVIYRLDP